MAKTKYDSKWDQTTADLYTAVLHNAEQDGIQQEFEERAKAAAPSLQTLGTVSLSIDAGNDKIDVTIAASSALFVAGIRYESLASMTFVAQDTGTYRLYVNNTTETTGSMISTDALPANCVQIGTVVWTLATTTLSSLTSWIPAGVTTLGDIIYAGNGGNETRLPGNTTATKKYLTQTGTGAVSADPAWGTITASEVAIVDAGGLITATEVEAALQEIATKDPVVTLTGDVTGAGTLTNLASVSFATTIAADAVDETMIDWGAGANQIDADDLPASATKNVVTKAAAEADIGATTNIDAVPGSFADLAAVQSYLAGANMVPNIESRLDAIEGKINALLAKQRTAGVIAA